MKTLSFVKFSLIAAFAFAISTNSFAQKKEKVEMMTKTKKTLVIEYLNKGSLSTIDVSIKGNPSSKISITDQNPVVGFELTDLNRDGYNEVLMYTRTSDADKWGNVIAVASNSDKSLSQVYVEEITDDKMAKGKAFNGWSGQDVFKANLTYLTRTFPVRGANGKFGKKRTVIYKMVSGEAGYKLVVSRFSNQ